MTESVTSAAPTYADRPTTPRWTHIALRVADIDASIDFYTRFASLELLDRRIDPEGYGAWLGHSDQVEHPFVLVLVQFFEGHDPYADTPLAKLAPFNHIGIELPTQQAVDEIAAAGAAAGCLEYPPQWLPAPVGYICMLSDPDGNLVEFSYDQGVYETARRVWGR